MAYRIDKETGDLIIDGFDQGIAQDPYSGIAAMRQVNIGTVPTEVSVGFGLTNSTVTSGTIGIPVHRATQTSSGSGIVNFICDASGQVFKSSSGSAGATWATTSAPTTGANATNQGMAYLQRGGGYLFRFRETSIDYYNGSSWVTGWNPSTGGSGTTGKIAGSTSHFAFVDPNSVLYFCDGAGIGSIMETAGQTFDPTNPATYTFASSVVNGYALALPAYDIALSITYLGTNLLVGGSLNAIYPWNRVDTSFNFPIFCAENYINKMVTANNNTFIFPGNVNGRGRIYITNGSQVELFLKFPDYLSGYQEPYYKFWDAIYHRNSLVFGVQVTQNGTGAILTSTSSSIWAIDCTTKVFRGISDIPGGSGSGRVLIPDTSGSLAPGYGYIVGYSDGSSINGIAYSGTAAGTGVGSIRSDIIPSGTFLNKKTFRQVEFKLATPLQSGESIQLQYTSDVTSGLLGTFTTSSTPTVGDFSAVNFDKTQWIQIYAQLTGNSPTSGCRLKEIRLR